MKILVGVLAAFTAFLGFRVFALEAEVTTLQRNTAIAVLSAEAANLKVGAIAPYFSPSKEQFAKAWIDSNNLPPAMFPSEVLDPLRRELERLRQTPASKKMVEETFGIR